MCSMSSSEYSYVEIIRVVGIFLGFSLMQYIVWDIRCSSIWIMNQHCSKHQGYKWYDHKDYLIRWLFKIMSFHVRFNCLKGRKNKRQKKITTGCFRGKISSLLTRCPARPWRSSWQGSCRWWRRRRGGGWARGSQSWRWRCRGGGFWIKELGLCPL